MSLAPNPTLEMYDLRWTRQTSADFPLVRRQPNLLQTSCPVFAGAFGGIRAARSFKPARGGTRAAAGYLMWQGFSGQKITQLSDTLSHSPMASDIR